VQAALDEVRPYLDSHGGDVELLSVDEGVVRLRMQGSCKGCPSSAATLKLAIEDAIHKHAPDVEAVEADGAVPEPEPGPVSLPMASWTPVSDLLGELTVEDVGGERILFARLHGSTYAYRARCPGCGASLEDATLAGAELACAACARHYDVRVAGRAVDDAALHLDPVPLLADGDGGMKVALGAHA
jgi:Fe-S cluster biogenesis protein NfuA/nitrite reductase/ring-hydroxylating ferredoxin subunit